MWNSKEIFYKTFRGFRVFIFRYRVKTANAELAEIFLHYVLSQIRLL